MTCVGIVLAVFVVVLAVVWIIAGSSKTRFCECPYGFTPNPHDGDCAVCRGKEP